MDALLEDILACPRDRTRLSEYGRSLRCEHGHEYPIYDGIPVLLLDDVRQTAWWAEESIKKAKAEQPSPAATHSTSEQIDPHVQQMVAATCGNLYKSLVKKLKLYPIPELRLPNGQGEVLVDIGCNWGRWSIAAARKGYTAVGIDPALDSILAARRVSRQLKLPCVFVVADARYLPFREHSVDVIFSYSVIQHFSKEDAKTALQSIASVLKTSGTSLIQMPNRYGIRSLYHLARRRFAEGSKFEVRYWKPSELRRTFTTIIGPSELLVDGYFGLGIQPSDAHMLARRHRIIVRASELLRRLSKNFPIMMYFADSLYVKSHHDDMHLEAQTFPEHFHVRRHRC